ncbi:MAG: type II toxin-antitoxin system VapC family toxin [Verrucomicrobia bacterium]|nr:type II toxin-antitoxin system VapC family toxin [Verrucomicrobiota bacterium]
MIVADTNVFMAVALGEPERAAIVEATRGAELIAPEVLPYEIGNALSSLFRRGILSSSQMESAWNVSQQIPVECRRVDIRSALKIAALYRIFAYDAYFLECALQARAPLLTLDRKMRSVAVAMKIDVMKVGAE